MQAKKLVILTILNFLAVLKEASEIYFNISFIPTSKNIIITSDQYKVRKIIYSFSYQVLKSSTYFTLTAHFNLD